MSTVNPFFGTATLPERTHPQSLVFKALAKRIASTFRCGLPGIITQFDPTTQYASVELAVTENLIKASGGTEPVQIPTLDDVLVLLPGSAGYCLTFPDLVNAECYVCFADMCVNAWSTHGWKGKDANGRWVAQDQELWRRHDLSDGFAILSPRNQTNVIPNYSTTATELRSIDNHCKISLGNDDSITLTGSKLAIANGTIITQPGTTPSSLCVPITINGVQYYIRLSTAP